MVRRVRGPPLRLSTKDGDASYNAFDGGAWAGGKTIDGVDGAAYPPSACVYDGVLRVTYATAKGTAHYTSYDGA